MKVFQLRKTLTVMSAKCELVNFNLGLGNPYDFSIEEVYFSLILPKKNCIYPIKIDAVFCVRFKKYS